MGKKRDNFFILVGEYRATKSLHNQLIDARDDEGSEVNEAAVRLAMFSRKHIEKILPEAAVEFLEEEAREE